MIVIGDPTRFAFEVLTEDKSADLIDLFIIVNGQRVSGGNPVYISTFLGSLKYFAVFHKNNKMEHSFPPMSPDEAFDILYAVDETNAYFNLFYLNTIGYYSLRDLDTAVDHWYIYIYDSNDGGTKTIVCRERDYIDGRTTNGELFSATVECDEFFKTISDLFLFFGWPGVI